MRHTLLPVSLGHEEVLGVGRHVEAEREGEVRVHFLLHHRHHVERVAHGVEAQDPRQLLETRSVEGNKKKKVITGHIRLNGNLAIS